MADSKEVTADQVMEAVKALRDEMESKSPNLEKIEKIEKVLEAQEKNNQELIIKTKTAEKSEAEMKERMDALEIELARSAGAGDSEDYKDRDEYKALNAYCIAGDRVESEQKQLLRTDNDASGGYLTSTELDTEITRKITEISAIRSVARVRTITSKALEMPVRAGILTATYEGEAEENEDDVSDYSNETLTTFRQTVNVPISLDMLMNGAFDMESEIMRDAGEAFAQGEGLNFVVGDGVKKPAGFVADARVVADARDGSGSSTFTADDVILLSGDLKVGYNPVYIFNRQTLAFIRTLKSDDGQFLWLPGLNGPVANTINGSPYLVAQDMPAIATDAFPIAFGDFQRGYTIVDRTGMSVIRDEFTRKKKAIVEFTINRWNYGQVTLPEAITLLKTVS